MPPQPPPSVPQRWAHFRFSVIGRLLAAPPPHGQLHTEIVGLAEKSWTHPVSGRPTLFAASTFERWFYQARNDATDPVRALRRRIRKDAGLHPSISQALRDVLRAQ